MTLSGVFAPVPTPFDETGAVQVGLLRAALERWAAGPLAGFIVLGSNGEAVLLDEDESDRVIAAAREAVPRRRPLIAGIGRESTQAAIRAAKRAGELGADFVLARTPGFFKSQMSGAAFVRHYTAVADSSPVPVLLYNFPAVTGVNLLPADVSRLAQHPNIAGIKDSSGDVAQLADLVSGTPDGFAVLAGATATFYAALCVGCHGGILAPACVVPDECTRLYDLVAINRHREALALQRQLTPVARLVGPIYGVPGLKAALKLAGHDLGLPRAPLAPTPPEAIAALRDALSGFNILAAPRA